jgi:hypothetical protein
VVEFVAGGRVDGGWPSLWRAVGLMAGGRVDGGCRVHGRWSRWWVLVSPEASLDRYEVESAFAVLQTYSLVQWRHGRGVYTIHELVHVWGRDRLDMDQQRELSLAALGLLTDVVSLCRGNLTREIRPRHLHHRVITRWLFSIL